MHLIAWYIDELEITACLTRLPILVAKANVEPRNEDKNNMVIYTFKKGEEIIRQDKDQIYKLKEKH